MPRRDADAEPASADADDVDGAMEDHTTEPTDEREILSWFLYDWCVPDARSPRRVLSRINQISSARRTESDALPRDPSRDGCPLPRSGSSPIGVTAISFWSLLITLLAKEQAAGNAEGIAWRKVHAAGDVCEGVCYGTAGCLRYDRDLYPSMEFERPDGMDSACEWFPVNGDVGPNDVDYGTVVVFCNVAAQLACGLILVFFGTLGDFGETASHTTPFAWCTPFLKDFSRRHSSPALPFQRLTGKTFN